MSHSVYSTFAINLNSFGPIAHSLMSAHFTATIELLVPTEHIHTYSIVYIIIETNKPFDVHPQQTQMKLTS